jgi:S1-C subfamily serine protease
VEKSIQLIMPTPAPVVQVNIPNLTSNEEAVLVNLYPKVSPAVVQITVYTKQGDLLVGSAEGSGFVYDKDGDIITNAHVAHGADALEATFSDGTILPAKELGEDLHSDLAVIKVDGMPSNVVPLPLGDMDKVAVGETVVAIGNPFGLGGTLTKGIVSALGRNIPALTAFQIPQSIQTDAPINPGNSGGPLLNLKGEVLGVNAQIETGPNGSQANSGVGFAIPVSIVSRVVPALIKDGKYVWGWLGVSGSSVTPTLVKAMSLPVNKGAYIGDVIKDGPADKAGLKGASQDITVDQRQVSVGGDVVVSVNGTTITSFEDMLIYIALKVGPGDTVTLGIVRDGKTMEVKVTLEPRPADTTNINNFPIPLPTP